MQRRGGVEARRGAELCRGPRPARLSGDLARERRLPGLIVLPSLAGLTNDLFELLVPVDLEVDPLLGLAVRVVPQHGFDRRRELAGRRALE